ncbi:type II toxin-antitoxin system HicB family antitoxin [Limosilactobacillus reuteri]|uniref:type II toxin-antitoxin system HicB family antitoxin n=1 Tax=Limosilactobacillus reuteri TaxID=1598 RepID=UPI001E61B582|nr:type II toxin-antitoxin system HicB family antitoxin [Limosilactobacillus reuteri]MCC4370540.1 type II toxin-antitoxin system HicB family antitoxin [Limosilactobacillus reuteri]MCC4509405.1 type II toxin-antitoxin system HicB family antitoxin [Limosilactobacillus reuteri]
MKKDILIYPVIMTECNDESGHYYGVTSPNIKGMVTDGVTMQEAVLHAEDAIATMISDMPEYPEVQDPTKWELKDNESVMWVTVNMAKWLNQYGKTVRRNISIPEGLNNWAKENKINVSQVTAKALREMQEA